jgi:hypothetical protein
MKVAILNHSGNTGKTTTTRHVFHPRVPDAELIAIESINTDDSGMANSDALRGREFGEVYARVIAAEAAIVDIGSSNIEDVFEYMGEYHGSEDLFDYYVVPVTPERKQQQDTWATIEALADRGISADRIRILFNRADRKKDLAVEFEALFRYYEAERKFTLDRRAVIYETGVFASAAEAGLTVDELAGNLDIYKERLTGAADRESKTRFGHLIADAARATGVKRELDAAFEALAG